MCGRASRKKALPVESGAKRPALPRQPTAIHSSDTCMACMPHLCGPPHSVPHTNGGAWRPMRCTQTDSCLDPLAAIRYSGVHAVHHTNGEFLGGTRPILLRILRLLSSAVCAPQVHGTTHDQIFSCIALLQLPSRRTEGISPGVVAQYCIALLCQVHSKHKQGQASLLSHISTVAHRSAHLCVGIHRIQALGRSACTSASNSRGSSTSAATGIPTTAAPPALLASGVPPRTRWGPPASLSLSGR